MARTQGAPILTISGDRGHSQATICSRPSARDFRDGALAPLGPRTTAEEPPLQRDQQLAFAERLDLLRLALLERVAHLVALEDVVVRPHEPIVPLGQSDRPAHRPDRAGFALDPDRDDLRRTVVAHATERPLGEPLGATAVCMHPGPPSRRGLTV